MKIVKLTVFFNVQELSDQLISQMECLRESGELSEELGETLGALVRSSNQALLQLSLCALGTIAKSTDLLTEEFLTRHGIISPLLILLLSTTLKDEGPSALKALKILRHLCYRLTPHYQLAMITIFQVCRFIGGKNGRVLAMGLLTASLIYPIERGPWKAENILRDVIRLLKSGDRKVLLLALEALHQVRGRLLVQKFVESSGIQQLERLLKYQESSKNEHQVATQACFVVCNLLIEDPSIFGKLREHNCISRIYGMTSLASWSGQYAAITTIRLMTSFKEPVMMAHLAILGGYASMMSMLERMLKEELTGTHLDITIDCLEGIVVILEFFKADVMATYRLLQEHLLLSFDKRTLIMLSQDALLGETASKLITHFYDS